MLITAIDEALSEAPDIDGFDPISMVFHWVTLVLLVAVFATAWAREGASDGEAAALWLEMHRSIGLLVWGLTVVRLLWRSSYGHTPTPPATMGRGQHLIATVHHAMLYGLLILQPITGFLQSVWPGKTFPLFGLVFPAIVARDKHLTHLFHDIHQASAMILLAMIGLHAVAALFHGLVLRDGVLKGMLPFRRPN
jgi:cytochrome b561